MSFSRAVALLLLGAALAAPAARAQVPQQPPAQEENAFDYTPENGGQPQEADKPQVDVNPEEVEVSSDPVRGTIYKPRNAWRLWIERTVYVVMLNIALIAALFFIPKKDELNLIISYFMGGVTITMNIWLFLCGILFIKMGKPYWIYALPLSGLMTAVTYIAIMKIKKADVSMAEVKSVFARSGSGSGTDAALASVDGSPGSWPDEDFIR